MQAPCDWDGESYCTVIGCKNPATHSKFSDATGDTEISELVCCRHAKEKW